MSATDPQVHRATGSVFSATWAVSYLATEVDPREDAAAWQRLIGGAPLAEVSLTALDLHWGGATPHADVPPDGFATVATTTVDVPVGTYRLRTLSDDGLRVWLDERLVIDDWTHHAPIEHAAVVRLDSGLHTLRVEHFELDGGAALSVGLSTELGSGTSTEPEHD